SLHDALPISGKKLSLTGAIKDTVVPLDEVAIYGLKFLLGHDRETFNRFYNIDADVDSDIVETYEAIGRSRGLKAGGDEINYESVTNRFIYDIRNAKIGRYTFDRSVDLYKYVYKITSYIAEFSTHAEIYTFIVLIDFCNCIHTIYRRPTEPRVN